jgi:hypothetical protein
MADWKKTDKGYTAEFGRAGKFTAKARPDGYFDLCHGRKKVAGGEKIRFKVAKKMAEDWVTEALSGLGESEGKEYQNPTPVRPVTPSIPSGPTPPTTAGPSAGSGTTGSGTTPAPTANSEATLPTSAWVELPETVTITGTPEQVAGVVGMLGVAESADIIGMVKEIQEHTGPYVIEVSPNADPAAVERVMRYATPLIGHAAMNRRDAHTDGAEDIADRAAKEGEEGVTFRIIPFEDERTKEVSYYAEIRRPDQKQTETTDLYGDKKTVRKFVLFDWPKAVEITPNIPSDPGREQKRLDMIARAAVLNDAEARKDKAPPMPGAEQRTKAFRVGRGFEIKLPLGRAF